jgi:hypothetical protein
MSTETYYTYDKSHRMTSQYILGGEAHYYTYNERNMVTGIQDVGGPADAQRTFVFDGLGERVVAFDSSSNPGQPAYWSYDGRKFLQDKQRTSLGGFSTTNYRHNSSPQDCPYNSLVEFGLSDASAGYPASDGAGNLVSIQNPTDGINDSFVANWFSEQITATDNFGTRTRALAPNGQLRGKTSQEVYYMSLGRIRIPSKNVTIGGSGTLSGNPFDPSDPVQSLLWLLWWLGQQNGSVQCQDTSRRQLPAPTPPPPKPEGEAKKGSFTGSIMAVAEEDAKKRPDRANKIWLALHWHPGDDPSDISTKCKDARLIQFLTWLPKLNGKYDLTHAFNGHQAGSKFIDADPKDPSYPWYPAQEPGSPTPSPSFHDDPGPNVVGDADLVLEGQVEDCIVCCDPPKNVIMGCINWSFEITYGPDKRPLSAKAGFRGTKPLKDVPPGDLGPPKIEGPSPSGQKIFDDGPDGHGAPWPTAAPVGSAPSPSPTPAPSPAPGK